MFVLYPFYLMLQYLSPIDCFQTSENISLNPGAGERAVLIKTGEGDSMILIGKWTGFVRGVAGTRGILRIISLSKFQGN